MIHFLALGSFLFFLSVPSTLWGEGELPLIFEEYKKGNYQWVESKVQRFLEEKNYRIREEKVLVPYVLSSSSLTQVETSLDKIYITNQALGPDFYTAVCYFLERALVLEEWKWMEKWGFRFRRHGQISPKYAEGLYFYAVMFSETGHPQKAQFLLNQAKQHNPNPSLQKKIQELESHIKPNPD